MSTFVQDSPPSRARRAARPQRTLGADAVVRALGAQGVSTCFGVRPGGTSPLDEALARNATVGRVSARQEHAAGFMALGYAIASGEVGVALASTSDATSLLVPIAYAERVGLPLLCLTGAASELVAAARPLAKRCWHVTVADEIEDVVARALRVARGGRPGPVVVDVAQDLQEATLGARSPGDARAAARTSSGEDVILVAGGRAPRGYGIAAGVGAKAARPEAHVVVIDDEDGFRAGSDELATAVAADLPLVCVLLTRGDQTWCEAVAESHGVALVRARWRADLDRAVEQARSLGTTALVPCPLS